MAKLRTLFTLFLAAALTVSSDASQRSFDAQYPQFGPCHNCKRALPSTQHFDVIILSSTPAGIMAAVANSRLAPNRTVLILERTSHIGGLPANGLGATDIQTRGATGGLFLEFVNRIKKHYVDTYGAASQQVRDSSDGYHFEPRVAEAVLERFVAERSNVIVLRRRQFDAIPENLVWRQKDEEEPGYIRGMVVTNRDTGVRETYYGKVFIDASYEGDLIGAAQVPVHLSRESQAEHDEIGAGKIYKYWGGPEMMPESTHEADDTIQAYNYRLTLTDSPALRVKIERPHAYNRSEYTGLIMDIASGCHTGYAAAPHCPGGAPKDPGSVNFTVKPTHVPGMPSGIARLSSINRVPNGKFDGNNQHLAFISTDLPVENWAYPTADWTWRDAFAQRLRGYTEGFMYFAQNDAQVPAWFRAEVKDWGWARDEFADNAGFPRQVYVREGRRMKGTYLFTAHDALPEKTGGRPSVHRLSVAASHYALDSHAVRKREPGRVHLDGFLSYPTQPYTVPFGVMVPDAAVANLLAPVPVSGTHVGFSTLRMEPCWMALGQAAGTAADVMIDEGTAGERGGGEWNALDAKKLDVVRVQRSLLQQDAVLVYFPGWQALDKIERIRRQWEILETQGKRTSETDEEWERRRDATGTGEGKARRL